jgi:hypothetical protein
MTNFNNLKKQAKQYLRWHRDRYHPVAAQIREALPRLRHLDDRQILGSGFKLSDAQELIARQRGFESWRALKEGTHCMTTPATSTNHPPAFTAIEGQLYVADVTASCRFFTSKLGFGMAFVYGDPPFYAQVRRDDARINLRMIREPVFVGDVRARGTCCPHRLLSTQRPRSNNFSYTSRPQELPSINCSRKNLGVPEPL